MTSSSKRVVIVGASVAGVRCATALRSGGFSGEIRLLDAEDLTPYDKPQLSKRLGADAVLDTLVSADELDAHRVELIGGVTATGLDVERRRLATTSGTVDYDELVIASGCHARPWPQSLPDGAGYVRNRSDWERLSAAVRGGDHLVVIGGGFLGLEVAAAARGEGVRATVVDVAERVLTRGIPRLAADLIAERHRAEGVQLCLGVHGPTVTEDGHRVRVTPDVAGDYVLVAIGAVPNTAWLADSGILLDNGIVCDAALSAAPGVWAIGDCARWDNGRYGELERHEHWTTAQRHAQQVATSIVGGKAVPVREVGYVWSDQFDWKIQSVGRQGNNEEHYAAANGGQVFLSLDDTGKVTGVTTINAPGHSVRARRLLADTDPERSVVAAALGLDGLARVG